MKTIAFVTLYFPDESVKINVTNLCHLVDEVFLLDNTNAPKKDNPFLSAEIRNAKFFSSGKNLGLSAAFNKCLKTLEENCFVLFFDQDSFCSENLIAQLKNDYEICCKILNRKGIIGPAYFEKNSNRLMVPRRKKEIAKKIYCVNSIITSGMFCELDVLKKINFWNEEIFLDMADWDLCWRAKANGFFCCLSENAVLSHRLGEKFHRGIVALKEGAPFRVYYQTRDCLRLLTKKYTPFKFRIRFLLMISVRPVLHLIFLPDRKKRMKYFVKGIRDFKNKIYGALEQF